LHQSTAAIDRVGIVKLEENNFPVVVFGVPRDFFHISFFE
jgi:hypothetical protein